ncbi:MAG: RdgB/HAM1 family non-canonical purine NTP pyrophosphatase [Alphaproteobacteria bacterium]|nr:RdgB/HAM1 family non-canonical purine NTP pyrophosphatase [Alphaproteobacteria bacterium]
MTNVLEAGMRLVVASHNAGKVWEIKQLIQPFGLDAVSAGDLNLPEPEETETTFAGNARLKAVAAATASGLPALADDSGLEVDCLGGAPGIYSARWAGPTKDFSLAMKKVAEEVKQRHGWSAPGPKANFICALCLAWPDGQTEVFEGRVDGVLVWPARGGNGFGYDPMFLAEGKSETFGEMEPAEKHAMSHRSRAFEIFKAAKLDGLERGGGADVATANGGAGAFEGLSAAAANLSTRAELAAFVGHLREDLKANPGNWENADLPRFLEAMQGWLQDETSLEDEPRWRLLAKALLAASMYE